MRTIMPSAAINAESTPRAMHPDVAEQLGALYVTHAEQVEALALAKLWSVDPDVDTAEALDVAAEVWLTLAGLAATGGLPTPARAGAVLRQIITAVVTDTHPCDRRERPAGLAPLHPAAPSLDRVEQLADAAAHPALIGGAR